METIPHRLYKIGTRLTVTENSKQRTLPPHSLCFSAGHGLSEKYIQQLLMVIRNGKKGKVRASLTSVLTPTLNIDPFVDEGNGVIDVVEDPISVLNVMDYDTLDFIGWATAKVQFIRQSVLPRSSNHTRIHVTKHLLGGYSYSIYHADAMLNDDKEKFLKDMESNDIRAEIVHGIRRAESIAAFDMELEKYNIRKFVVVCVANHMYYTMKNGDKADNKYNFDDIENPYNKEVLNLRKMVTNLKTLFYERSAGGSWMDDYRCAGILSLYPRSFGAVRRDIRSYVGVGKPVLPVLHDIVFRKE